MFLLVENNSKRQLWTLVLSKIYASTLYCGATRDFTSRFYSDSQNDLATVFISRCIEFLSRNGFISLVSPQNWLFQPRYKTFRRRLLEQQSINFITRLGSGAFESISGEIVKAILVVINAPYSEAKSIVKNIDIASEKEGIEKYKLLLGAPITTLQSDNYLKNPDLRITTELNLEAKCLSSYATTLHGQNAGDNSVFNRYFWEVPAFREVWETYQNAPAEGEIFSGRSQIIMWENENGLMARFAESVRHLNHKAQQWRSGKLSWGKKGVAVSLVGRTCGTLYEGDIYGVLCGVIIPNKIEHLGAIWSFVESGEMGHLVKELDPNLAVQAKTLLAVAFNLEYWTKVAEEKYPNGLPKPYSDDPTQWIFHGHPATSDEPLQVAVARLLGYRFPAELDPEMELADEARALIEASKELLPYADGDGIICLPPVRGERPAADRLRELLARAYGSEWSPALLADLLTAAGSPGKTLDEWLRQHFFEQHYKLFHQRPFIWHIWDGRRDGFAALVNYHKLDRHNLERLAYTYLGDWIKRQEDAAKRDEPGADTRLHAARELQTKLASILTGEPPFDIFVRWKPIERQPIGWEPDLNDGVRLNIRPFITADILRKRPSSINWNKDRGKNPPGAPWGEDRHNDVHLTVAEKQAARTTLAKKS